MVRTTTLSIRGMSCGACVRHLTKTLDALPGVVHVDVNLRSNVALVEHLPGHADAPALIQAVRDAGYDARVARTVDDVDVTDRPTEASSARGCGCCGAKAKLTAIGDLPNLDTSTIC